ncbi:MAG: methionyl-tRNA formyltransferase [Eubacteriales bacterium]|nr:methionyl-tRNA formyltransferase [Eubacteriales bacterium]
MGNIKNKYRIIFMGTPGFALPSLNVLIEEGHEIAAVVTRPDKPKGRGGRIEAPPVGAFAKKHGLELLQPVKVREADFVGKLRSYNADLFITAAYGRILTGEVLSVPLYGCINVHASLLPELRGAAPIQWALIKGYKETGITTMMTDEGMDTGDILLKSCVKIAPEMNSGELHDILAAEGAAVLKKTLEKLSDGTLPRIPQDHSAATYAPLLTPDTGRICWSKEAYQIHDLVRGLAPYPGAYTFFRGEQIKIWKTACIADPSSGYAEEKPGTVTGVGKDFIKIACGSGELIIIELQACSCRRMSSMEYLCGHMVKTGEIFE